MGEEVALVLNGVPYTKSALLQKALGLGVAAPEYERSFWNFVASWYDENDYIEVSTSGSTGAPKTMRVKKQHMANSARMTCAALELKEGASALLCLSPAYIAGKMMVVRAIVGKLNLTLVEPSGMPQVEGYYDFCAMVPMQLFNLTTTATGLEALNRISKLIIGGGAVSSNLRKQIAELKVTCYSTYGMTETVSHIALKQLNGKGQQQAYHPMHGVKVGVNSKGCLVIDAPQVSADLVETTDMVQLLDDGTFHILGRYDNIINSGGVKISPEEVEHKLSGCSSTHFAISSVPDERLGEMVVIAIEGQADCIFNFKDILTPFEVPRKVFYLDKIPTTANGKIDRRALKELLKKSKAE